MRKSSTHFKAPHLPFKQEACGTAFVAQAFAAVGEPAVSIYRQAVTGYLLEAALALDCAMAPHQPVVPCLEGLGLSADRQCAGPTGGGHAPPVQDHKVCREREGFLLPAVNDQVNVGHAHILTIILRRSTGPFAQQGQVP